jgi:hypothetical protein
MTALGSPAVIRHTVATRPPYPNVSSLLYRARVGLVHCQCQQQFGYGFKFAFEVIPPELQDLAEPIIEALQKKLANCT